MRFAVAMLSITIGAVACRETPVVATRERASTQSAPGQSATCSALPAARGSVIRVIPAQAGQLADIVASAPAGAVILLADGNYGVSHALLFQQSNVTMRSLSAQQGTSRDASRVTIDGLNGFSGQGRGDSDRRVPELVRIVASDVTISDLTLRNARDHLIHVYTAGHDTQHPKLHNLRLIDPGQQAIKVNTSPNSGLYTDDGEIACSFLELTDTGRTWVDGGSSDGCYSGGIDAHQSRGWRIVNNTIKGFWCQQGLSEHAIHVWTGSRDTIIEGNEIVNSARGIGLGLGRYDGSVWRNYSDGVCGGKHNLGHYGGRVRNNTVFANDRRLGFSQAGFDTGVGLESACDTEVANNTVISTVGLRSSAIEWRFPVTTGIVAMNNLTNGRVFPRDGANGTVRTNVTDASPDWFVSMNGDGDLRLARSIPSVVQRGTVILDLAVDKDGHPRAVPPDVGAYEYRPK